MQRIVCDTMIWYDLSKGKLSIPDPRKFTLVCTYLTLTELAFTPNNFGKLNEVKAAIKQIVTLKPEFILTYPFNHAKTIIDKNYNPKFNVEEDLVFGFLRMILNHPNDEFKENEFERALSHISKRRSENSKDWADFLNKLKESSKGFSWIFKKYSSDQLDKRKFKQWFVLQINKTSESTYSSDTIDWTNFEFYESIYKRYHRNLIISKMKADNNDDKDLGNMVYVQPNDLYWTLEKRWLSIAKEAKVEKYWHYGT